MRGLALATLLEEGLPAWLHAIASALDALLEAIPGAGICADAVDGPANDGIDGIERDLAFHVSLTASTGSSLVPPVHQQEIAMLLANLALSRKYPAHGPQRSDRRDHGGTRC